MAITPRPIKRKDTNGLDTLLGTLLCLYTKAKRYHFNVTGPTFHGDHVTYDGIASMALNWYDLIGERMRALNMPVDADLMHHCEVSVLPESIPTTSPAPAMLSDMLHSLEAVSGLIHTAEFAGGPTTENMVQELDAEVGKHSYFVRSSM